MKLLQKRLNAFKKEFECVTMIAPHERGAYLTITGEHGKIEGIFSNETELLKFLYTIRKRWRSLYYGDTLGFEERKGS